MQWCTDFFVSFRVSFCRPSVDLIPENHTREQMSKGLRSNTATEEMEGDGRSSNLDEHGSEMMTMLRVLMEEQKRSEIAREEARRREEERKEEVRRREEERREEVRRREAEKREELRVEREIESAKRQLEQQKAFETRQYEQQLALLTVQSELGEKASRAHREGQTADRRRDRALYSISVLKEGEDLEEFILTAERRLRAAETRRSVEHCTPHADGAWLNELGWSQ